ncbi:MAG: exodeoxyribonuclease VII large subunit [Desulfurellaceae bacterium]|nr:exodeoxyribonuclease VII large subunit [Desulfurellaceae bacterium]
MTTSAFASGSSRALSVTDLASLIQGQLEADFGDIWVVGELSGLRTPASGHIYFTLKDETSQLRGVMFRGYARLLRFRPEDGLEVLIKGRVSLYSARGDLQVYAASMEPRGLGGQQLALEQLKAKLASEGLFAPERKRPLPFFPRRVGVVTALGGAAIQDILTILHGRCPYTQVVVRPTKVQGAGAGVEIAAGINDLNEHGQVEVIIVGRGGGSREDLYAFNEEVVARAIADSDRPVIAAVGHEIDLSIADLVADSRAPTPTAAAEMVVPVWADLSDRVVDTARALTTAMQRTVTDRRRQAMQLEERMRDPQHQVDALRERTRIALARLHSAFQSKNEGARARLEDLAATLNSLSPLAVLGRGYSLTRTIPENAVVRDAATLRPGENVRLTFAQGEARARVEEVTPSID